VTVRGAGVGNPNVKICGAPIAKRGAWRYRNDANVVEQALFVGEPQSLPWLGFSAFGAQVAAHAPPVVLAYLERETSTILRIRVAKAIITPRAMHASAKVI
jgi:hypothetical protein